MSVHLFILAVLLLTTYGQLVLKARSLTYMRTISAADSVSYLLAMFTDVWALSGWASAVLAGCFWMLAIQNSDLGYAYPFMALSFVLVPIGAAIFFGEPLPLSQLAGLALIVGGVTVSTLSR